MRRRLTELYWAIAAVFESLSCRALKLFRDGTSTSRSERPFERPTTRFLKNIVVKCAKSFLALAGKASLIMRWLLLRADLVGDRGATWGLMDKLINSRSFWNLYIYNIWDHPVCSSLQETLGPRLSVCPHMEGFWGKLEFSSRAFELSRGYRCHQLGTGSKPKMQTGDVDL